MFLFIEILRYLDAFWERGVCSQTFMMPGTSEVSFLHALLDPIFYACEIHLFLSCLVPEII